ncbi:MAG: phosphate signaling complex protein PhoU [Chloroflexi bacterium]|nr:phosphate signaling complex protein PhoU [Chloroflexota bacterium]MCY3696626.1 phosphate signaling complex protein PhoU [Chloroflexota bacterium]MXX30869.1 phosphate signaling complex protein PhoU [Chloroflexota bacterium]MXX81496.1 phosphate signaling complex protein PhoU [Chloroflexota bacterium]MYB21421.1 phosphate signaling complex protein PhoU [Chloroflexota bacterium]
MSTVRLTYSADRADILDRLRLQHARADRSIVDSMQALLRRDLVLARRVCEADEEAKQVRYAIEEAVTSIIALQQPVAGDLRELMSIVPITLNLERIAGHAEGIARIALFLEDNPVAATEPDLWRMADLVREMLQSATRSFLERDQHLARLTVERDDDVDELYGDIHERLIERLAGAEGNPEESDAITHVIWTSHNLERMGDRALNICERTVFLVTGRFERQHGLDDGSD